MRHRKDVSNGSDELTYQLQLHDDVSAWSGMFKLVTKMVQFLLCVYCAVNFLGVSGGSVSLTYKLVRCYNVSKMSVLFRYQLWHLCDEISWPVSLRYQLVRRYDVSNRSVLFMYQWDVAETSQIGLSHWRTSCDVAMTSYMIRDVSTYMRPKWDGAATLHARWDYWRKE